MHAQVFILCFTQNNLFVEKRKTIIKEFRNFYKGDYLQRGDLGTI